MGITITYQEYDQLCQTMPKLDMKLKRLPNEKEILMMSGENTIFFLSLFVWLLEKDNCIPETEKGEQFRMMLNDYLDEGMKYFHFQKEKIECSEKVFIDYDDYERVYMLADKIKFLDAVALPSLEDVETVFYPASKFSFGLILILLVKNKDRSSTKSYQALRNVIHNAFLLKEDKKCVEISRLQYDSIIRIVNNLKFPRKNWWPSMDEVKNIIAPNFEICFSFVMWLLENGTPETLEQKKVKLALEALKNKNTRVFTDNHIDWI